MTKEQNIPINAGSQKNGVYEFGMIDVGGASAQISYVPTNPSQKNAVLPKHFFSNQNNDIPLFVQSYLGYGMYESRSELEKKLLREQFSSSPAVYTNPCFLVNNTQTVSADHRTVSMEGTGDYVGCHRDVIRLFKFATCFQKDPSTCHLQDVVLPSIDSQYRFIAIDNAYRAAKFFDHLGYNSIHDLEIKVSQYCELEWHEAIEKYSPLVNEFRLKRYCYEGTYLVVLLKLGYVYYTLLLLSSLLMLLLISY